MKLNSTALVLGTFVTFILFVTSALGQRGQQSAVSPIVNVVEAEVAGGKKPWVTRSRVVDINTAVLGEAALRAEERPQLALPLFNDVNLVFEVQDAVIQSDVQYTLKGAVRRALGSYGFITVRHSNVSGFISLPGVGQFTIRREGDGRYRVSQVDPTLMPQCGVDSHEPVRIRQQEPDMDMGLATEPLVIELYVIYTPAAAAELEGAAQLVTDMVNAVATTNLILNNSEINVQIKLSYIEGIDYIECADEEDPPYPDCMGTIDLADLAAGEPPFDAVHQTRGTMCADLVMLIVAYGDGTGEPAGIAQPMLEADQGQYMRAFSVVQADALLGTTVAHELGHNFGAAHDHAQPDTPFYSFAYGHRFDGQSALLSDPPWITVMSYAPGITIPHFSNPNVLFDGAPTGIRRGTPFEADVALMFANTAPYVATYGDSVCLTGATHLVTSGESIQAAIDAANNGDQVVVGAGTYNETIDLRGKEIILRSQNGPGTTIIDGSDDPGTSVVTFDDGEEYTTIMSGFTIRNGLAASGGGMTIINSSPYIANCHFVSNEALISGGGVYTEGGDPVFVSCRFIDNSSSNRGGGLYAREGEPRLFDVVFQGNSAGNGTTGYGGGMYLHHSHATIHGAQIGLDPNDPDDDERNTADTFGGGIFIHNDDDDVNNWIVPNMNMATICGNTPNNVASPWNDWENNTICELDDAILVPDDYPTIQEAINIATDGDVIEVAVGTYEENIDLDGKAVHLRSTDPTDPAIVAATIIDGGGNGSVVTCISGETSSTIIDGFTIRNGSALHGGGIRIQSSSPTVDNCVITDNSAGSSGGGIYVSSSSSIIEDTLFTNNVAESSGGGIAIQTSNSLKLRNCSFENNHSNHIGGGLATHTSNQTMTNLAFVGNTADQWGGGAYSGTNGTPIFLSSTFADNSATEGGGIFTGASATTGVAFSSLCGNTPSNIEGPWDDLGGNTLLGVCPPLNNSPDSPTPISSPAEVILGSFAGATNDGTSSCDPGSVDVFYSYTIMGGPSHLTVDTCGSAGTTAVALFDSDGNEVGCSTSCATGECSPLNACLSLLALPDGEYLIRISRADLGVSAGIEPDQYTVQLHELKSTVDLNGDGVVDVSDLLALLSAWGSCHQCPADFDGNGMVDVSDLLVLLSNWS